MYYSTENFLTQIDMNKFSERKIFSLLVADAWERVGDIERAERIRLCGSDLVFAMGEDGRYILVGANFCRDRVCSMCAWRRSLRLYAQVSAAMDLLEMSGKYSYIFLTLTLKNVQAAELIQALNILQSGYKRLTERREFSRAVRGYFRATEITYSAERGDYHPHMHVVLAVPKSYFTSRLYISSSVWSSLWQQSIRAQYTPVVDVRRVRNKRDSGYSKAVAEVAKYAVKPADAIDPLTGEVRENVIVVMSNALAGRRLIGWGGVLRQAHAETSANVSIAEDLTEVRPDVVKGIVRAQWNGKGYTVGV